jgi:FMN phosphatase YigB (HAD superfamily)
VGSTNSQAAYHVGDSIEFDVLGASAAGWTPLHFKEWFDEDFPDWTTAVDTPGTADQGQARHEEIMYWGRRDTTRDLEWVEIWALTDVLRLFGFPLDESRPLRTTYIRAVLDD